MKIAIFVLFAFLFYPELVNAQTDFKPGFIISTLGDTIYGEIDYRGDTHMGALCRFMDTSNSITNYLPGEIVAYRFNDGKYYVSYEVENKNVFLEYLINGEVDIYYLRDEGDHYYISNNSLRLMEIPYESGTRIVKENEVDTESHKDYRSPKAGEQVFYESTKHYGILEYYMKDAEGFRSNIYSIKEPNHKNLTKLAEDYHNTVCDGEACIIYERKIPLFKVLLEPVGGFVKYTSLDKFGSSTGLNLHIWTPRVNEKIFFKTGIVYQYIAVENNSISVIKIPLQVQYLFRRYKLQPKISTGVNFMLSIADIETFLWHSLALNYGLNYEFSENFSIGTSFNTNFTSFSDKIIINEEKFGIVSFSLDIGLVVEF